MNLYEYQAEDLKWFLANPKAMILYEPRLGKTVLSVHISALDPDCTTILVLCPKNAILEWRDHFKNLWGSLASSERSLEIRLIRGKGGKAPAIRKELWLRKREKNTTVFISTYGAFQKDAAFLTLPSSQKILPNFKAIFPDEVHKLMKNRKNVTVQLLKYWVGRWGNKRYHALSGTLAGKGGPIDFWPNLNIIDPKLFGSYWAFANQFCEIVDGAFGKEIIGPRNLEAFHKLLDKYSRRRFRRICRPDMPNVVRSLMPAEPTTEQLNMFQQLKEQGYHFVGESGVIAATSLEQALRARQIATCPRIFGKDFGVGAAIEDLADRLDDEDICPTPLDKHIVVFTEFRAALDHFERYLRDRGYSNIWQLHGSMDPELQQERVKLFRDSQGIILCTSTYAEAFSLAPAQTCYHIGYSWDPNVNKQAEDRLVPQQGDYTINSYYYHLDGIDTMVAHTNVNKEKVITVTIGSARIFDS